MKYLLAALFQTDYIVNAARKARLKLVVRPPAHTVAATRPHYAPDWLGPTKSLIPLTTASNH